MLKLEQEIKSLQASLYLTQDKEEKLIIKSKINKLKLQLWQLTEELHQYQEYQIN